MTDIGVNDFEIYASAIPGRSSVIAIGHRSSSPVIGHSRSAQRLAPHTAGLRQRAASSAAMMWPTGIDKPKVKMPSAQKIPATMKMINAAKSRP
jgi:hypothetical protein